MKWLAQVRFYLRSLFARKELDDQLTEEVRTHVAMATEANVAKGMAPDEAHYAALREFGNVAGVQERTRGEHGWVGLEQFWQDLRYAARSLAKAPGFTLTVWGTLTVGIGLASMIIGLTWPALFAPKAERLYQIGVRDKLNPFTPIRTGLHLQAFREQVTAFSAYAAVYREFANVVIDGHPQLATQLRASNDCFSTLEIKPVLGRTFLPEEHQRGADGVVILASHFWREFFDADPKILGKVITVDQQACIVIGVFDANQVFPPGFEGDIYRPLAFRPDPANPLTPTLLIAGRLKPGVTVEQAEAQLAAVKLPAIPPWAAEFFAGQQTVLQRPFQLTRPETQWVVLIAAVLLYALACLNASNLTLVRLLRRRPELAMRLVLGGTRWRVARLLLLEGVGLTGLAGLTVLVSARWIFPSVFVAITQKEALRYVSYWNGPVLGAIAGLSLVAGVALVLAPVRHLLNATPDLQLKAGNRAFSGSRNLSRLRTLLIMLQTALAVILLAGAGLMVRTFDRIRHLDLGFDPVGRVKVQVMFPPGFARAPQVHLQLFRRLADRLGKLHGVKNVAIGQDALLIGNFWGTAQLQMPDGTYKPVAGTFAAENLPVTAGLVLRRGRWLKDKGAYEVVINESLARARFGDADPVGKSIRLLVSGNHEIPVVGVVKDVRESIRSGSGMRLYAPVSLYPPNINTLLLQLDRDPGDAFAGVVRQAIYEEEPGLIVPTVKSMHEVEAGIMSVERSAFTILKGLSLVALTLAAVGLFSVVIYTVDSRTREFGVRTALGAMPSDLHRLVFGQGLAVVGVGILLGLSCAMGLTRFMQSLLFETTPNDPVVFVAVASILLGSAALACWLPARRAAKVDPVVALRAE